MHRCVTSPTLKEDVPMQRRTSHDDARDKRMTIFKNVYTALATDQTIGENRFEDAA